MSKLRKLTKIIGASMAIASLFSFSAFAAEKAAFSACQVTGSDQITINGSVTVVPDPEPEPQFNEDGTPVIPAPVPQDDGRYYLFELKPYEDSIGSRTDYLSVSGKQNNFTYQVSLQNGEDSRLYSKFALARYVDGKFEEISSTPIHVTNPEATASYTAPYPEALTKKGLLIEPSMIGDAFSLGVRHTIINIPFHHILGGTLPYTYKGKTYYFNQNLIEQYDTAVSMFTEKGIVVSAIILNGWNDATPELIFPGVKKTAGANYYGFNTATQAGYEETRAIMSFLANRYSGKSQDYGRISNWVIGNELNNNQNWNYMGQMDLDQYVKEYERSFRVFYTAIRSENQNARVFFSTDYNWNQANTKLLYGAKDFIDRFNTRVRQGGNINWGLAYHPYPMPLTEPEFWDDDEAHVNQSLNTSVLNFKNLNVLTDYFQTADLRDSDGEVRHIILSEQGFTSQSPTRGDVQEIQAAAFAYAYYLVDSNPYIDAFILSRQIDAAIEVNQSLAFGLWTTDLSRPNEIVPMMSKQIWRVFRDIDSSRSLNTTEFAKKIIGIDKWRDVIPNFKLRER